MPKYIVKSPVKHDGDRYAVGDEIELSAKQAALLGEVVEAADATEPAKGKGKGKDKDVA